MKDLIVSLSRKNKYNAFMKNKVEFHCKCGYSEMLSYYAFLSGGDFSIGQPASIISPFISETIYDETITATPIHLTKKCPDCSEEITAVFPLSVEDLVHILQVQPPDPIMYG